MRGLSVVLSMGALTLVAVGCQTITEELPTQPVQVVTVGGQVPVVVVPVQLPSPTTPTPAPVSTPRPIPTAEPGGTPGGGSGGGGGHPPNNNNPVVKLGAKVFFVECDGRQIPDSEHATEAPVGCRVHLDVTKKDANNQPTNGKNTPHWSFSNESIIKVGNRDDYTPTFLATGAGTVSCWAEADGVTSNTVTVRLY